jgi:hypothetical protein
VSCCNEHHILHVLGDETPAKRTPPTRLGVMDFRFGRSVVILGIEELRCRIYMPLLETDRTGIERRDDDIHPLLKPGVHTVNGGQTSLERRTTVPR